VILVVENRTESRLAFTPALIVEACAERTFTKVAIDASTAEVQRRIANGKDLDIPPGAADFTNYQFARPIGATFPVVVVVTKDRVSVSFEPFDRSSLPVCAGQARP